jgi:hypothetical protein
MARRRAARSESNVLLDRGGRSALGTMPIRGGRDLGGAAVAASRRSRGPRRSRSVRRRAPTIRRCAAIRRSKPVCGARHLRSAVARCGGRACGARQHRLPVRPSPPRSQVLEFRPTARARRAGGALRLGGGPPVPGRNGHSQADQANPGFSRYGRRERVPGQRLRTPRPRERPQSVKKRRNSAGPAESFSQSRSWGGRESPGLSERSPVDYERDAAS